MPAASYREGPDGHSSRKQNSKRRRAKCSPSFVSGRVIGHGDIPPRCVPERLSAARFRHGAFPGGNPWQFFRLMHLRGGFGRENRQFAARFARHASEMSWLWQDMRAMHPKSPANSCLGIHRAQILPSGVAKPPERPRPRHRRTVRAARARSPGPRNTAREAAPPSLPGQQVPPAAPAPPPPLFANTSQ